jgi:class 3 adenylate cyclase/uncharacterized protein (DUF427 family)
MTEAMLAAGPVDVVQEADAYEFRHEPAPKTIEVTFGGETLAWSSRALLVRETRLPPVYYLPISDVHMEFLEPSGHKTYCPFKGTASYWHVKVGDVRAENAAWSYLEPLPEAAAIGGYLAFYSNKMDALYEADRELTIEPVAAGEPLQNTLVAWLLREAWEATDAKELTGRLARQMVESGIPLWRINILLGTLNPLVAGTAYVWSATDGKVEERRVLHERRQSRAFLDSPLTVIYDGAGGLRRRLEGPDAVLDFPILAELKAEGATDYVAMPMHFSDGHINAVTLAADRPGGFTTEHLGRLYEVLPLLSRLYEVHAAKRTTRSLMTTYLGGHTADLVLAGRIKRGDGEIIPAVIWYADMRGSTRLAVELSRESYLSRLNAFFDAAAGAVLAEGGEVLKFIGDAVLGIFPITECEIKTGDACRRALAAADRARADLRRLNGDIGPGGPLEAGIALHKGEVTYGNVGAAERLDFTVIGPAANEVARLGELCRELRQELLVSQDVADYLNGRLQSLGRHCLRGLKESHELFTVLDEND